MNTIKACPCGSVNISVDEIEPIQFDNRKFGIYWNVVCECGWRGPVKKIKRSAIKAWNRRADKDDLLSQI